MQKWKTVILPAIFRVVFSFVFLWAFFDKLIGLKFSTLPAKSWLMGNSPTLGFLSAAKGPFAAFFHMIAGSALVDWMFMLGLLGIGLGLLLGVMKKITGYSGALLMILMWAASLPLKTNPIVDDHIVYLVLFLMYAESEQEWCKVASWWNGLPVVKKYTCLR